MKGLIIVIGVVILLSTVIAAGAAEITGVVTNFADRPGALFIKITNQTNPGGCVQSAYLRLNIDGSEGPKRHRQSLLASYLWSKTIIVTVSGCSGGGTSGNALITNTELK